MKRRIATMMVALPLMAGGVCLAEEPGMKTDSRMETKQMDNQKVVTKRLSKCIGKDIYNHEGKKVGDIKDVVLDGGTNRVSYVVISYGGVMGIGDKLFAVPWRALETRSVEPDKMFLNVSEDTMKNAPGFDEKHWPDMANKTFRDQIDTYYSTNAADKANMAKHDAEMKANEVVTADKAAAPQKEGLAWCRRASAVIGADVRNPANENLGSIDDLVVNAHNGKIQYAVLSFGGIMGIGDKLFAVPINSLQSKTDDDKFVLDVSKDRLKDAPGFNKKNWPDFADPQFRSSVDDYYSTGGDTKKDAAAKTE